LSYTSIILQIGYVAPDPSLLMAAGLGIAKAISAKQNPRRFAGEVMDNDTDEDNNNDDDDENITENNKMVKKSTLKHSNLLSAEEKEVIAGLNPAKQAKTFELSDGKKIIVMNMNFTF